eukprot:SM000095S24980  [mRNA]  locus=s95:198756:205542:- [translate_table: standard]
MFGALTSVSLTPAKLSRNWRKAFLALWLLSGILMAVYIFVNNHRSFSRQRQRQLERICMDRARMIEEKFWTNTQQIRALKALVKTFHLGKMYVNETKLDQAIVNHHVMAFVKHSHRAIFEKNYGLEVSEWVPMKTVARARETGNMATSAPFVFNNKTVIYITLSVVDSKALPWAPAEAENRVDRLSCLVLRIDDVTEDVPLGLYVPQDSELAVGGPGLPNPYHSAVYNLDLGDSSRRHELRCGYAVPYTFPKGALLSGVLALVISLLLLEIIWEAFHRIEQMEWDYHRMEALKDEMKAAKVAAEAGNMAKSAFLATISHEIRTPMNGMLGMINLLIRTPMDNVQLDYCRTAQSSGNALIYLINDVLDLSKIESGRMELESITFNLHMLVDDVLSMFASVAQKSWEEGDGLELAAQILESVPRCLVGDPVRLRQVLVNLIGNALKFTQKGHILLKVKKVADKVEEPPTSVQSGDASLQRSGPLTPRTVFPSHSEGLLNLARQAASRALRWIPGHAHGLTAKDIEGVSMPLSSNGIHPLQLAADEQSDHAEEEIADGLLPADGKSSQCCGTCQALRQVKPCSDQERTPSPAADPALRCDQGELAPHEDFVTRQLDSLKASTSGRGILRTLMLKSLSGRSVAEDKDRVASRFRPSSPGVTGSVTRESDTGSEEDERGQSGLSNLSLVHLELVAMMGGNMTFVSELGVGTTFEFDILLEDLGKQEATAEEEPDLPNMTKLKGLRALIVDERPVRAEVTASYLLRLGVYVEFAEGTEEALQRLEQSGQASVATAAQVHTATTTHSPATAPWDIVLVDSSASSLTSWAALQTAFVEALDKNQGRPGVQPAKLVLLATTLQQDDELLARKLGFSTTLLKPLRSRSMAACLLQALEMGTSRPGVMTRRATLQRQEMLCMVLSGKQIMVVDDNLVNRKVASATLARFGAVVHCVESGKKALQSLAALRNFDCILMDVQMPEMDGYETTKRIRDMEKSWLEGEQKTELQASDKVQRDTLNVSKRLPILALTADVVKGSRERCEEAGMDGFVTKPIEEEQLWKALMRILYVPPSPVNKDQVENIHTKV